MLSKESDINREEEARRSADAYVMSVEKLAVPTRLGVPVVPVRHTPIQTLPPHFPYHVNTYLSDLELFQEETNIPAIQWGRNWRARQIMFKVASLPAVVDGSAHNVLKKSEVPHEDSKQGLFSGRPMVAGEVAGYPYGSIMYPDLSR